MVNLGAGQKDILIVMSDQHSACVAGFMGDAVVRTPQLDRIAAEGVVMEQAYTPYPLCVPARMAAMSGMLASETGVTANEFALSEEEPTIAHSLAAIGYETVLCGRMHFVGENQKHGFMKRIAPDLTPHLWGTGDKFRSDIGEYTGTFSELRCLDVTGGGNSPVLEYDKMVIDSALKYLREPSEKPRFIVVGIYAPHSPFVCPPELFDYYRPLVAPPSRGADNTPFSLLPYENRFKGAGTNTYLDARAAYYGMIENMDSQIGEVFDVFNKSLAELGREGIFVYCSDHGEMLGEYDLTGKTTLLDNACRIPMIFSGAGIAAGRRINAPVSLIDLYPTLCELSGAPTHSYLDGTSLLGMLYGRGEDEERCVISELVVDYPTRCLGRMAVKDGYKYIEFPKLGIRQLFSAFNEEKEISDLHPEICDDMSAILAKLRNEDELFRDSQRRNELIKIHWQCGRQRAYDETYRWIPPYECTIAPKNN